MYDEIKEFLEMVGFSGSKIWKTAHTAMVDDTDNNMVDVANTKHNGPAQGMYNMFLAFDKGYMVSHYPESRGWFKI